jgi:hypothetical protein
MTFPFWNKALAWKEWRQNWWQFWTAFVLISATPMIGTLWYFFIKAVVDPGASFAGGDGFTSANAWSYLITQAVSGESVSSSTGYPAVFIALALGVNLIAQERTHNSLEFLVSTPVSRREIAATKYLMGAGVIVAIMAVNLLFILFMALVLPATYTTPAVLAWFAVTTSVLLAVYSLGFLIAAITGNLPAAFLGALGLAFAPKYALELLQQLLLACFQIAWFDYHGPVYRVLEHLGNLLTLPYYLKPYSYMEFHVLYASPLAGGWLVPPLLLAAAGFSVLGVRLFERNPLERTGEILMFGDFKALVKVAVSLLAAAVVTMASSHVLKAGPLISLLVFLGIYVAGSACFSLFYRSRRGL